MPKHKRLTSLLLLLTAIISGLIAAEPAFAGASGSKEELSVEFAPEPAQAAAETAEGGIEQAASEESAPDTSGEPGDEALSAGPVETVPSAPPETGTEPEITPQEPAPIKQAIKTYPIKVVEDRAEAEEKAPVPAEHAEVVAAPIKRDLISPSAVPAAPSSIKGGVINRWFGLETGVETMGQRGLGPDKGGIDMVEGGVFNLEDCIDIAIKNHIPLQVAEKSMKLAGMRVIEARRNMLPSVTVVFEPYSGKVNKRNYVGRKQYIEGKQPLFHGGELFFTLRQAETNLEVTRTERDKIKNELVLQVKKAYYALAKAGDNLRMQRELSAEVDRIYRMVNDQFSANVASKLELLNVSSQSSQIKYQLASADGDVAIAELILKQAMNVEPEVSVEIKPNLEFKRVGVNYADALRAAFLNRPELKINQLMMEYYQYGKRIAFAKSLPKIDLMGSWGLARENYTPVDNAWGITDPPGVNQYFSNPVQKLEEQWYAGIKTSLPFWGSTAEYSYTREQWTPVISAYQGTEAATNSFKLKLLDNLAMFSEKQLSEVDFDRARQEMNKMRQDVTLEVKEQCFNYEKALIQLETASYKVKYQESDFEFVKMKRSLDEVQDSTVIESMIKLSQERFGYVQALADCHTSLASVNKAIGVEDYFKAE